MTSRDNTARSPWDAELHVLRSVAHASEGRGQHEIEKARRELWQSLVQAGREDDVPRWIEAVEVAVQAYAPEDLRPRALAALGRIREGLGA